MIIPVQTNALDTLRVANFYSMNLIDFAQFESFEVKYGRDWEKQRRVETFSGWWFGTFFIFPYIWNNHPN